MTLAERSFKKRNNW